ncbi:MAG: DUF3795 domain-containing protein [Syntrophobacterales bacterium]|jgi:hypothetical protein|nr:DUF3795 domain-containing protein [Syntrophobacterales bacterium]
MDYAQLTAPCGLPCFACYRYLANEDEKMRQLVSRELGIPVEQAVCSGCRNLQGKPAHLPMPCRIYPCAGEHEIKFCCDCANFPCDYLHPYFDNAKLWHNTKVFHLCLIRKLGLEAWAQNKAAQVLADYSFKKFTL